MGPEGGHTLQAKEILRLVAPFRARYYCPDGPQATQTSSLCTLGFAQFKADGLVEGVAKLMSLIIGVRGKIFNIGIIQYI